MADKVPIRAGLDGSSVTGLAIFASGETIGVAHGGTGLATVGSNQLVTGNGTSAMTSESNLTFDGSTLKSTGAVCATGNLVVGGNTSLDGGTFTFNDSGADVDFRIEGDSEANLFVADASVDRIGIGTATPSHLVDIEGVAHAATCFVSADVCATTKVVTAALCVGSEYALPAADGSAGQILCTDGSGTIAFAAAASSGHTIAEEGTALASRTCLNFVGAGVTATDNSGTNATDVTVCATNALLGFRVAAGTACTITLSNAAVGTCLQSDTAPKLGGNLDVNSNSIISASNGNIPITPNGSGIVILDGICHPTADGSAGQVLCTNGSAALQWATLSAGVTLNGSTDNTIATVTGSNALQGESNLTFDGSTLQVTGALTVGVDDTGHDVKFFGATSDRYMLWDESGDLLNLRSSLSVFRGSSGTDRRFFVDESSGQASFNTDSGSVAPDGHVHIHSGSAGTVSANTNADDLVVENGGAGGISILTPDASDGNLYFGNPSGGNLVTRITRAATTGDMVFGVNSGTEQIRILSSGGITFNGDTAAANALDDYEEGTWTPLVRRGNSSGTAYTTGSSNVATYTKIGRVVYVAMEYEVTNPSVSNDTTNVVITGLPFTTANINQWWRVTTMINLWTKANGAGVIGAIGANDTYVALYKQMNNGTWDGDVKTQEIYQASGSVWIGLSGFYHV